MTILERIKADQSGIPGTRAWHSVCTIDMHTGGEPLRVILGGYPRLSGTTVLERRRDALRHHDAMRTTLMFEPRGHADMYGCVLVEPNDSDADFGIIFLHNEGYSTMCGHAIIAISKLVFQMGWKELGGDEGELKIDAPCGRIVSYTKNVDGKPDSVRFYCVPSFVVGLDRTVDVPELGKITYDLAYGGAFYAYVDLEKNQLGFSLTPDHYRQIIRAGVAVKQSVIRQDQEIIHPVEPDLSFLYGTIFISESQNADVDSRNVCVFADGEVDRSPTGSGVSGRMAIHAARGELEIGETMRIESILDSVFSGSIADHTTLGQYPAVIPEVAGNAYITGQNRFLIDPEDPLNRGFILR